MSLGRNIQPVKPHTNKVLFNCYDGSKRRCLLACQKASKTRSLKIFSERESGMKDDHNIWKHLTRNRGITKLTVKITELFFAAAKFRGLERLILLYQNLMSLYFDCSDSAYSANSRLARPWVKSRMLKELHYTNHTDKLTNDDLVCLFARISHMPQLSEVSLHCVMTGTQLDEPPKMLPVLPSRLTSIRIHIDGLSVFWNNYINTWLLKNKSLKTASLTLVDTEEEEEEIDPSLENALKCVSQCDSISLFVVDFISLNGLNSLLQEAPGAFERIRELTLEDNPNLDVSTFSLAVPYLRNLVHFEMYWGAQDVTETIIEAFSCVPPKSLKTFIITMKNGMLTQSITTGLQKILKETNLEEFEFRHPTNYEFPLLKIVITSCLDRPTCLRKLRLDSICLLSDRIKEIKSEHLYFDSVKELDLLLNIKNHKEVDLANKELKNLVNMLRCFKKLENLSFNFYYPIPNSFFVDLIPLFNVCPLRRFDAMLHEGVLNFNQLALESLVCCCLRIKTWEELTICIFSEEEQLNGLSPINLDQFTRFDSQLKKHQKINISIHDNLNDNSYKSERNYFADLTKRYQF